MAELPAALFRAGICSEYIGTYRDHSLVMERAALTDSIVF
jgi:hypothetical protein